MFVSPAPQPLVGGVFVVEELELVALVLEDARVVEPELPELAALPDRELVPEVPGDEPLAPLEEPLPLPGEEELPFPVPLPPWPALPEFPEPGSEPDPGVPPLELPHAATATAQARIPSEAPATLRVRRMRLSTMGDTCTS
jgi:hypothetical protein